MKKTKFAKYGALVAGALLLTACASSPEKMQSDLVQGQTYFAAEKYEDAYTILQPLADDGNAEAQYAVGYMLFYGKGVIKDQPKAVSWFQKASANGHPKAKQALTIISSNDGTQKTE